MFGTAFQCPRSVRVAESGRKAHVACAVYRVGTCMSVRSSSLHPSRVSVCRRARGQEYDRGENCRSADSCVRRYLVVRCLLFVGSLPPVRCRLSVVRLSVVGCRLSVVGCRLPGCWLSVVGCQVIRLSVVGCRLSVVGCRLPATGATAAGPTGTGTST